MLFALLLNISAFAATGKNEVSARIPVIVEMGEDGDDATSKKMTVTVGITPLDGAPAFDQDEITVDLEEGDEGKKGKKVYFTKKASTDGETSSSVEETTIDPSQVSMEAAGDVDVVLTGFTDAGDYEYLIEQTKVTGEGLDEYLIDKTVYRVIVAVRYNDNDYNELLEPVVKAIREEDLEKVEDFYSEDAPKYKTEVKFVNYTCYSDPPVKKVVVNDNGTAPDDVKFRFSMKADDKSYPMPSGSVDGVKTITTGVGEYEFGNMYYKELGTYTYKVVEENDGAPHFTYDGTMYTVKVEVKMQDGKLVADRTITYGDLVTDIATFTNHYKESTDNGGSSTTTTSSDGTHRSDWNDGEEYNDPAGSVLGAVRDAIEDGPVGQVLGAARDLVEDSPVGQVLGAVRGATRTGDNSFMMVSGLCFIVAMAVLAGWVKAYIKRTR